MKILLGFSTLFLYCFIHRRRYFLLQLLFTKAAMESLSKGIDLVSVDVVLK